MKLGSQTIFAASVFATLFLNLPAHASLAPQDDPYYQVSSVTTSITEQTETDLPPGKRTNTPSNVCQLETLKSTNGVDPMAIAEIALKVWDIVVAGKPIVNVDSKSASALPNLADGDWRRLVGWKRERSTKFVVEIKNGFKMTVIKYTYYLKMIYGGGVRGKGQYISSARIMPAIDAKWGWNIDVVVSVPSIINQGTEEDPLAAIYLDMTYQIHNVLTSSSTTESYLMQGDGLMMNTNTDEQYFDGDARLPKAVFKIQ